MLKKQDRIISKTQRFGVKTNKYRIRLPNTVKDARDIDKDNCYTLCWDAIMKEIKKVQPVFEVWEKRKEDLPIRYQ